MREPNNRLRAARERQPSVHVPDECMGRRELAEAVNAWLFTSTGRVHELDAHYIAKLERGVVRWPSAAYRSGLRHVLRAATDDALGFRPTRRGNSAPVAASLPAAANTITGMATIRAMTHALHLADRRVGGGGLYDTAIRYLATEVAPHLVDTRSADGAELFAAAGSLSEITGWMAHDAGHDDRARQHFDRAYRFAVAAHHPALTGSVCASLSHLAGQLGHPTDATRIAATGLTHAKNGDNTGRLTARLHAMNARAHAMRNDKKSCITALHASEQALSNAVDEGPAEWTAPFDEGSLAAEAALCLRQLGQLDAAQRHARRAVSLRNGDRVRGRAFSQVTLARVLVDTGHPAEAATVGRQVCEVAPTLTSHRIRGRLDRLAAALIPHQHQPDVSTFLADVRTLSHTRRDQARNEESWPV